MKNGTMPKDKKNVKSSSIKAWKQNLTRKSANGLNFNLVKRRGRRGVISLLTQSYKLTKLRENYSQSSISNSL